MGSDHNIEAVLFDFDSTLTKPGALDFKAIKNAVGCPEDKPVFEFIESLEDEGAQEKAFAALDELETKAAEKSEPNSGAEDLIYCLRSKKIRVGIISRNALKQIEMAIQNFKKIRLTDFDIVITRDTPVELKPSKECVLLAARELEVDPGCIMVVGDYLFDIQAGNSAGAVTVFLDNNKDPDFSVEASDYRISSLGELKEILGV